MNNMFYNLPEDLQQKIIRMNPHPIAELFNEAINYEADSYNHRGDYSNDIWRNVLRSNAFYNCFQNYSDSDDDDDY